MFKIQLLIIPFFFFANIPAQKQTANENIRFEKINNNNGLPDNYILDIFQDSTGMIWLGCSEGLIKYDGSKFFTFNPFSKHPYKKNQYINCIKYLKSGFLILSGSNGISIFNIETEESEVIHRFKLNDKRITTNIIDIFVKNEREIWLATIDGLGLLDLANKTIQFPLGYKLFNNHKEHFNFLYPADNEILYAGSNHGIYEINLTTNKIDSSLKTILTHSGYENVAFSMYKEDDIIWIGQFYDALKINLKEKTVTNLNLNQKKELFYPIYSFEKYNSEYLLVGTNSGIAKVNKYNNEVKYLRNKIDDPFSPSGNIVTLFFTDKDQNIWVSLMNMGLNIVVPGKNYIKQRQISDNIDENNIYSILRDSEDNLWLGTFKAGLLQYHAKSKELNHYNYYNKDIKLNDNNATTLIEITPGVIWTGSWAMAITEIDTRKNESRWIRNNINDPNSINLWSIRGFARLKNEDAIYVAGIDNPVNKYYIKEKRFEKLDIPHKKGNVFNSWCIYADKDEKLWISTEDEGVKIYDSNKKTTSVLKTEKGSKNSLSDNNVFCFCEDQNGNMWIGTAYGLNKYDKKGNFVTYLKENGLPSNKIIGILEDKNGKLWISTSKGLSRFDQANNVFSIYTKEDGVLSNDFNHGAYYKDKEGILYFGNSSGYVEINPSELQADTSKIELVLNEIKLSNQIIKPGDTINGRVLLTKSINYCNEINLYHYEKNITIGYSGIVYSNSKNVIFQYQLEGFDKEWITKDNSDKSISFNNLSPGTYLLKIKCSNREGKFNNVQRVLKINIIPPFYKTWWFIFFTFFILVGMIIYIIYIRFHNIISQKALLKKMVDEKTKELVEQSSTLKFINNTLVERETELNQQKEDLLELTSLLEKQNEEIQSQRDKQQNILELTMAQKKIIEKQNKEISDSIKYAQQIQKAIFPSHEYLKTILGEYFILFKPKDVISGDFYWIQQVGKKTVIILADCTGHGVPGAIMSIMGITLLNETIKQGEEVLPANEILNHLRDKIANTLSRNDKNHMLNDGMDVSIVVLDREKNEMEYAGANSPVYIIRDSKIIIMNADRMPVGRHLGIKKDFSLKKAELFSHDRVYLFSDGYYSQFGGLDGKKMRSNNFKQLLIDFHLKPMPEQKKSLKLLLEQWTGHNEQVDDILVIGVKI